jgi:hypothetical protein
MKIFISGSAAIKELTQEMKDILDLYMLQGADFIVGDCEGVDLLAQAYLRCHGYEKVVVYTSYEKPQGYGAFYKSYRSLAKKAKNKTGNDFFEVKDKAMSEDCDMALALWNGKSVYTRKNIARCTELGKKSILLIAP